MRPVTEGHLRLRVGIVHEGVRPLLVLDILVAALAISLTYQAALVTKPQRGVTLDVTPSSGYSLPG